jgi:hypothetical protein
MAGLKVRPAGPGDHSALEGLFRATSMGSSIRLNIERDPDYFAGALVQAEEPCVWAAFDESGRAAGMLSAGKRRVWVGGGEQDMRYLCDLRIHRDWQRSTLLARGFRLLKREVFAPSEWAQTLVLEDNLQAIELLSSHRAGLPEYRPAGIYITWLLPSQAVAVDTAITVRRARRPDLPEMQRVYNDSARRRSFAPVVDFNDLGGPAWRDLAIGDFRVAGKDGRIAGMLGLWDQSAFQRLRIAGYSQAISFLRPLWNAGTLVSGGVALPRPGDALPLVKATAVACHDDDPAILRALLGHVLKDDGGKLLLVGMSAADPLAAALQGLRGRQDRGRHFLVGWEGEPPAWQEPFAFDVARI